MADEEDDSVATDEERKRRRDSELSGEDYFRDVSGGMRFPSAWLDRPAPVAPVPTRFSAIYGEDGDKGQPDYPNAYQQQFGQGQQQTPVYPQNAPQQSATGYPPEQIGMPFNLTDAGQPPQEETAPPPIRTFAGNYETTPQPSDAPSSHELATQLGPKGYAKFAYLNGLERQILVDQNLTPRQKELQRHEILRQKAELIHVHEEGEAKGAARALALHPSITNPTGQQQTPQQTPIFSEQQKQQIGQLQGAEQRYRAMAAGGHISQEELQQGLQDVQQQMQAIRPIGMSGQKPNQPGTIHVDQQTGKAFTFDEKGVVQELENERPLNSLGQLPAHEAHKLVSETAAMYGETDQQAIARLTAREMMIRGQPVPPALLAQVSQGKAHKGAGEKAGPGEAPMTEEKHAAASQKVVAHADDLFRKDNAPETEGAGGVKKPGGNGPFTGMDRDQVIHAELVKAGLAKDDGTLTRDYAGYLDAWKARHGAAQQLGQPEQIAAPTEQVDPNKQLGLHPQTTPETRDFLTKTLPALYQQAGQSDKKYDLTQMERALKSAGNVGNMDPGQRYEFWMGMKAARKLNPSAIPEEYTTDAYLKRIKGVRPGS